MIFFAWRFAERAAEDGEVLAEDVDDAAVDRAPAGDDAVAGDLGLLHAEVGRAMLDVHVEFLERTLVHQELDALAGGQLAALVLGLDAGLAAAQPCHRAAPLELVENVRHVLVLAPSWLVCTAPRNLATTRVDTGAKRLVLAAVADALFSAVGNAFFVAVAYGSAYTRRGSYPRRSESDLAAFGRYSTVAMCGPSVAAEGREVRMRPGGIRPAAPVAEGVGDRGKLKRVRPGAAASASARRCRLGQARCWRRGACSSAPPSGRSRRARPWCVR